MVAKTVRRAFSGLTAAFTPEPKARQRTARTLKAAQQHADEAWRRAMHGVVVVPHRKNQKP
jgi:predicted P-loop ATPase/GTPase